MGAQGCAVLSAWAPRGGYRKTRTPRFEPGESSLGAKLRRASPGLGCSATAARGENMRTAQPCMGAPARWLFIMGYNMKVLLVYSQVRTVHLERIYNFNDDIKLIYNGTSYDFDEELANKLGAKRLSFFQTIFFLVKNRPAIAELNEPSCIGIWLHLIPYIIVIKLTNSFLREKTAIVAYAIDNIDPTRVISKWLHLPHQIVEIPFRYIFTLIVKCYDRVAFGTQSSVEIYMRATLGFPSQVEWKTFDALDKVCTFCQPIKKERSIIFVGRFDERKGLLQLMDAWQYVYARNNLARLYILGKGHLLDQVTLFSNSNKGVSVIVDPTRKEIHEYLNKARVLVLLSQPEKYWREQVGLPILEGLSHGCEIIASEETGISDWLRVNGHRVLPSYVSSIDLSKCIESALINARNRADIIHALPTEDTRMIAARWLWRPSMESDEVVHPS